MPMNVPRWARPRRWLGRVATATRQRVLGWRAARRALRELEVGRYPDGSTVVLDYRTGQFQARRPKHPLAFDAPLVPFEYADLAWLSRVMTLGGYMAQVDDDEDLEVRTEAGPVYVQRCETTQVLRFFVRVAGNTDFMGPDRHQTVNALNMLIKQGRWLLNADHALFMSCELYAGVGVSSAQVLSALRTCTHEVCAVTAQLGLDRNVA